MIINKSLALTGLITAALQLHAQPITVESRLSQSTSSAIIQPAKIGLAIQHYLGMIQNCQTADGMLRLNNDKNLVCTRPYFSHYSTLPLLATHKIAPGNLQRVRQWLIWNALHQEKDGTICDHEGDTL